MLCYVKIPGNTPGKRIGIVKWHETGYYPCDYDTPDMTEAEAASLVADQNGKMGIPPAVAESALSASMFGWDTRSAWKALQFEEQESPHGANHVQKQAPSV